MVRIHMWYLITYVHVGSPVPLTRRLTWRRVINILMPHLKVIVVESIFDEPLCVLHHRLHHTIVILRNIPGVL